MRSLLKIGYRDSCSFLSYFSTSSNFMQPFLKILRDIFTLKKHFDSDFDKNLNKKYKIPSIQR